MSPAARQSLLKAGFSGLHVCLRRCGLIAVEADGIPVIVNSDLTNEVTPSVDQPDVCGRPCDKAIPEIACQHDHPVTALSSEQ